MLFVVFSKKMLFGVVLAICRFRNEKLLYYDILANL